MRDAPEIFWERGSGSLHHRRASFTNIIAEPYKIQVSDASMMLWAMPTLSRDIPQPLAAAIEMLITIGFPKNEGYTRNFLGRGDAAKQTMNFIAIKFK